jgi:hypothetical protein
VIASLGGDDTIFGRKGNDVICGGAGEDVLDGMGGRDPLSGGPGRDLCLALKTAEHQLHSGCEVHVGGPSQQPPNPNAQHAIVGPRGLPYCGGLCDAGIPSCTTGVISYRGSVAPSARLTDPGYIAVAMGAEYFDGNGQLQPGFIGNQVTYGPLAGGQTYSVPPNPDNINPYYPTYNLDSFVYMFFNYSPDGQQWTGWRWDVADVYDMYLQGYASGLRTSTCST